MRVPAHATAQGFRPVVATIVGTMVEGHWLPLEEMRGRIHELARTSSLHAWTGASER
jgi:hypothetical protein